MIVHQFSVEQFQQLIKYLEQEGHRAPFDASYTVCIHLDEVDYDIRVQPASRCRIAALQALRHSPTGWRLITHGHILSALFELMADKALDIL